MFHDDILPAAYQAVIMYILYKFDSSRIINAHMYFAYSTQLCKTRRPKRSASGCCFTLGCFQNQRTQINFNDSFDKTERAVLLANLYKQLFFQML